MEKNESNSLFSFIPKESFITYKKVLLITPDIKKLNEQIISKNNLLKCSFYYDKYTNQFIYINGEVLIILDTKCKIKVFSRIVIKGKIKSISIDYNNKYLVYTTYDYKSFIVSLLDLDTIDCFENKKAQYLDGFFIPYKSSNKEHDYFILCMISREYFNISRIKKIKNKYNNFEYSTNNSFISNKMKIYDFKFNHFFKILLIIKTEPISFYLYNLKSKSCYKTPIIINGIKIKENETKLYLENIYKKLYLINIIDSVIEVYKLKNFKEIKKPLIIKYNTDEIKIKNKHIFPQFYNNFIIIYMKNIIKIYDIKSNNNNYEIFKLNIANEQYINTFNKGRIFGKYILINNIFYKIKFLNLNYKNYGQSSIKDIFFTILRRRNNNKIIKQMLYDLLNNYKISLFFQIIEEMAINNKKYIEKIEKNKNYKEIKNDPFQIIYMGSNTFFLSEDYILGLFNQYFDKEIKSESFIKILGSLYNIYSKYNINLDINLFYSSLFCHLNKIDDLNIIEFIIKNRIIPINEKLGTYFIIRAKGFKNKEKYNQCYNIGVDILLNENKYDDNAIKEISIELINKNKYYQICELIYESYFQKYISPNKSKK